MPLTKATTNVVNLNKDTFINGLTAGRGGGNISTNTALGINALLSNTTGTSNTATGSNALRLNTTGINNVAVGVQALENNTTGNFNVAVGIQALDTNTTGTNNTAVGNNALYSNTTGAGNTATGSNALRLNTIGVNNVAVGLQALENSTIGINNVAVGVQSLDTTTTGSGNTAVGRSSLYSNTTGTDNTAVGNSALFSSTEFSNAGGFGHNAQVTASNQVQLGDSATTTYAYGAVQNRSDIRDKADVRDTELGLEFVNALRPVDFKWDMREDYRSEMPIAPSEDATEEEKSAYELAKAKWLEDVKLANITHDGSKKRSRFHHGLIAQEVKAVLDAKGIDFGGFQDHSIKGGDDVLSIGYVELISPMLKAIQQLSARVEYLESK